MHELLTVVAHEVSALGADSCVDEVTVSEGPLPDVRDGDVYVVIPHEYFVVLPPDLLPTPEQLARTIGFCVEHPGNDTFDTTVRYARELRACVDINDDSTAELNSLGISTERFVLGYSDRWDRWGGGINTPRPNDLLYLGTTDDRRSRILALDTDALTDFGVFFAMPPHEPMIKTRPDFLMGDDKFQLLAASKVLLNLHRGASRSLEWVRVLEAMCNGCVVVSEHSPDIAPLRPGEHLLLGRPRTLVHLARSVLSDPSRLADIRTNCYEMIRTHLPMRTSALMLTQLAQGIRDGQVSVQRRPALQRTPPSWPDESAGMLVDEGLRSLGAGRPRELGSIGPTPSPKGSMTPYRPDRSESALDVAIIHTPGSPDLSVALSSLIPQLLGLNAVIHLCTKGAHSRGEAYDQRIVIHEGFSSSDPWRLLNEVLHSSDAPEFLVLGSGDILLPSALQRLRSALRVTESDAAYGMVITPQGLFRSAMPFEPTRVARTDYLATASIWRRRSLLRIGGWTENHDEHGGETWDLWRRLAVMGGWATLVARPLVHQAFRQTPELLPD
jgi:hypothetical protein